MAVARSDAPAFVPTPNSSVGRDVKKLGKLAAAAGACYPAVLKNALKNLSNAPEQATTELNEALFEVAKRCEDPTHLDTLVSRGASVNARDDMHQTPLHVACSPAWINSRAAVLSRRERGAEMVEWLLAHKADPHAPDHAGYTALHTAAFIGDDAGARALLAWRADPNVQTTRGATPLEVIETTCWSGSFSQAQCEQHGQVVAVLTKAGGRRSSAFHSSGEAAKTEPAQSKCTIS